MITVIHHGPGKDPDIYFGIDEKTENKIITDLRKTHSVERCSEEEWFGQSDRKYAVHHWNVARMK